MSKRETHENRLLQIVLILLALTLISFWLLSNMYARYVTQSEGSDSARVAQFQIENKNNLKETYVLNPMMSGSADQKITVGITNDSEVAVKYTFTFKTDGNLPLTITGSGPSETTLQKKDGENVWTIDKSPATQWDEVYTFNLSLENDEESYQYAGGVEKIQLTVQAEQID